MSSNNILSYFIKDIKDLIKRAYYKQQNKNGSIIIFHKNEIIFMNDMYHISNYINNIYKTNYKSMNKSINKSINTYFNICNYKIGRYYNLKHLYYKHNKNIKCANSNYITFYFIYEKYLVKTDFSYVSNNKTLLNTMAKYHNGFKYIITIHYLMYMNNKYTKNIILIMNKYELYYYNKFFNIYLLID